MTGHRDHDSPTADSPGADPRPDGATRFRVWAPARRSVEVVLEASDRRPMPLDREPGPDGYFAATLPGVPVGARYRYRLDGGDLVPDPASRFQPEGPEGPSQVVDPRAYRWADAGWTGLRPEGQVIYELHVGTFAPEGTWDAAVAELPRLRDLGVTGIELMPVAEFAGSFGWGYDGVNLFAPYHPYGPPDAMRRFVDAAHRAGLGVVLDVVYNHLGPVGNFVAKFADTFFSKRHKCEWGEAINFDGEGSGPVRAFFRANVAHWVRDFHIDGFRFDATQAFYDSSPGESILAELVRHAREVAAPRSLLILAENEPQDAALARPPGQGGSGFDALWNDDFHHAAILAATGRREAYYRDYRGTPQELVSTFKRGYLYQGQRNIRQGKRRGKPTAGLPPRAFVAYLESHDQVANSLRGARLSQLLDPATYRAITGLFLLMPDTVMLFQGQEYASTRPFRYFLDIGGDLGATIRRNRADFLSQFPSLATDAARALLPDPADPATFLGSKLDPAERERNAWAVALHRDLLRLRRDDPTLARQGGGGLDGAVLGERAFLLRYLDEGGDDRLIVVNLGETLDLGSVAEPLIAPPEGRDWSLIWSSENVRYGGHGTPPAETLDGWSLPARSTLVLRPALLGPLGREDRHD